MKDPAFLFYPQDFLVGTMTMTFEDRGKYITLLSVMHQQGKLSEETIRFLIGLFSDSLRLKFKQDENGLFYNERLCVEIEKRTKFIESRSSNGKLGGRPKKKETYNNPLGYATDNLIEDVNVNEDNKLKLKYSYADFLEKFNSLLNRHFKVIDKKTAGQINARLKEGFTIEDILTATENCSKDKYHIENPQYLTPEFITRSDKLQKYLNSKSNGANKSDYDEMPFDNSRFTHH